MVRQGCCSESDTLVEEFGSVSLYIDLSEFLNNPITTGIQRIEGEICRCLEPGTAMPVRHHAGRYVQLPAQLIGAIGRYFRDPSEDGVQEVKRLGKADGREAVSIFKGDVVLVPEVIIEQERLTFLNRMSEEILARHRFIVYDLLPMTHPEFFWSTWLLEICQYYRILRRATSCGFISEDSRDAYYGRLKRTPLRGGIVLPLGCDALGPKPVQPSVKRSLTFSVLGTVEPRKNHKIILDAFLPLLGQVEGLRLEFIGKMGWIDADFAQKVQHLAADSNSGFRFHTASGDNEIRERIERSRATIYVSTAEGYGLPPVESIWLGTPVIASRSIPSLKSLPGDGIHFVEPLNAANLRQAVLAFLDDNYASRKAEEAAASALPTWHSFTEEVLRWCAEA